MVGGRRALPALLLAAALTLSGCSGSAAQEDEHEHADTLAVLEAPEDRFAGLDLAEPYRRPTFTLTDTTGAPYDFQAATAGRPTLLFFGYTNCPDVCPTTMADVAVALRPRDDDGIVDHPAEPVLGVDVALDVVGQRIAVG